MRGGSSVYVLFAEIFSDGAGVSGICILLWMDI